MTKKSKPHVIVPEECPQIVSCKERVSSDVYDGFCKTPSWIECESAKPESEEFKATPNDWKLEDDTESFQGQHVPDKTLRR